MKPRNGDHQIITKAKYVTSSPKAPLVKLYAHLRETQSHSSPGFLANATLRHLLEQTQTQWPLLLLNACTNNEMTGNRCPAHGRKPSYLYQMLPTLQSLIAFAPLYTSFFFLYHKAKDLAPILKYAVRRVVTGNLGKGVPANGNTFSPTNKALAIYEDLGGGNYQLLTMYPDF